MGDDATEYENDQEELETFFANVYEFVEQWVLPRYLRNPGTVRWDPNWFENIEALDRLEAMWRAWEYYRLEGMTGMAVFWRDQFDPTMRELTDPDNGVFWYINEYAEEGAALKPTRLESNAPPMHLLT